MEGGSLRGPLALSGRMCAIGARSGPGAIVAALPAFACPVGGGGYILPGTERATGEGVPCFDLPAVARGDLSARSRGARAGADRTEAPVPSS